MAALQSPEELNEDPVLLEGVSGINISPCGSQNGALYLCLTPVKGGKEWLCLVLFNFCPPY